jgi:hypothetical protein
MEFSQLKFVGVISLRAAGGYGEPHRRGYLLPQAKTFGHGFARINTDRR